MKKVSPEQQNIISNTVYTIKNMHSIARNSICTGKLFHYFHLKILEFCIQFSSGQFRGVADGAMAKNTMNNTI